jgi:hypothetical protein
VKNNSGSLRVLYTPVESPYESHVIVTMPPVPGERESLQDLYPAGGPGEAQAMVRKLVTMQNIGKHAEEARNEASQLSLTRNNFQSTTLIFLNPKSL